MENTVAQPSTQIDLEKVDNFHALNEHAVDIYKQYNAGAIDGQTALDKYDPIRKRVFKLKAEIQAKFGMNDQLARVTTKPNAEYDSAIGFYDFTINSIDNHIDSIKKAMAEQKAKALEQKSVSVAVATGQLPEESRRV